MTESGLVLLPPLLLPERREKSKNKVQVTLEDWEWGTGSRIWILLRRGEIDVWR